MKIVWSSAGATHRGRKRRNNEDSHLLDPARGVFLVADGMGGHAAGEVASRIAAETTGRFLGDAADAGTTGEAWAAALRAAAHAAHAEITTCCENDARTRGMGTTLTACVIEHDGTARIGHIGDSRAYLLRDGALRQLTIDHTLVQRELDSGLIGPAEAAKHPLSHILSRVLASELEPEIDLITTLLLPGDRLLLATDGLYNMLPDARIGELLAVPDPPDSCAAALITAANRAGGMDNITVVLVEVAGGA